MLVCTAFYEVLLRGTGKLPMSEEAMDSLFLFEKNHLPLRLDEVGN